MLTASADASILILLPRSAPDTAFEPAKLRSALDLYFSDVEREIRTAPVDASSPRDELDAELRRARGAHWAMWFGWAQEADGWSLSCYLIDLSTPNGIPLLAESH